MVAPSLSRWKPSSRCAVFHVCPFARERDRGGAPDATAPVTTATCRDLSQPGIIPETLSMCLGGPASVRDFAAVLGSLEILAALLIAIRQ